MAVTVLKTKIENLNIGDKYSTRDKKYPPNDVLILENGRSLKIPLIESNIFISL